MSDQQHAPVEQLAAYAAGDLDATSALEVEAHVLLCADCRSDVAALQRVSGDLAAVPQVTMPADVAARIDAALERERGAATGATPAAPAASAGPVGDLLPMRRKRWSGSFAGLAAVAAGVALVAAISIPLGTRDRGADRAATEASGSAAGGTRRLESGLNYAADDPRGVLTRALSGQRVTAEFTEASPAPAGADPMAPAADNSAGAPRKSSGGEAAYQITAEVEREYTALRTDPGRLAACLNALAGDVPDSAKVPLLVDFARFDGRPALIAVFPTVTRGEVRGDRIDFWAVGPHCGITPGDDDVLHFARLRRPAEL